MAAANDVLLDTYGRVGQSVPAVLDGLSSDQAAWQPRGRQGDGHGDGRGNSVGWLVWHLTRVLDSHVAEAAGERQVAEEAGYEESFALDLRAGDTGYGHGPDQVEKVRFDDLALLARYHADVQEKAAAYLRSVDDLDQVVDEHWDPPVTLGVRLVSVGDDMARHVGQAEYVRGLLDAGG